MNAQLVSGWGQAKSVREAGTMGFIVLVCLASLASGLCHAMTLPARHVAIVTGVFALFLVLLLSLVYRYRPHRRFGAANGITLVRVAIVTLLLGLVGAELHAELVWLVVGLATLAACLDALDGPLARRCGTADGFGARFDLEADAAFVLVLCILAWYEGKADWWVLVGGFMRYAFGLAGLVMPRLRAALPKSTRRQAACVIQVVLLIVCLAPVVQPPWSAALAAAGLVTLSTSFLIDTVWLFRTAGQV